MRFQPILKKNLIAASGPYLAEPDVGCAGPPDRMSHRLEPGSIRHLVAVNMTRSPYRIAAIAVFTA
jgi:hypothetical protein